MKAIWTMIFASLLLLPACSRNDNERVRASSDQSATTDVAKQQRDDYVKSIDAKLSEFDQKVDGLDARAKAFTGAAKTDFNNAIDGLRDQRKAVAKKVDDLKSVSVDSWLPLKAEVDSAVADMERSYDQVSATHEATPATSKTPAKSR